MQAAADYEYPNRLSGTTLLPPQQTVLQNFCIFVNCNWVFTRWQHTFTHKQYIEQHKYNNRTTQITTNVEECGPCPVFASFTLAFALQLRKKHGKTSVRVVKTSVRLKKSLSQCTINILPKHPHKLLSS